MIIEKISEDSFEKAKNFMATAGRVVNLSTASDEDKAEMRDRHMHYIQLQMFIAHKGLSQEAAQFVNEARAVMAQSLMRAAGKNTNGKKEVQETQEAGPGPGQTPQGDSDHEGGGVEGEMQDSGGQAG